MPFCRKCGAELKADIQYCPNCGLAVTLTEPPAPPIPSASLLPQRSSRPVGVTILTALEAIASLVMLLGGAALLVLSAFLAAGGWDLIPEKELAEALAQMPWASTFTSVPIMATTTAFLTGIGLVLLILAVVGFIMTWGLWSGKPWARTITMILAILGIITGILSLPGSLISILIDIALLYYLTRPHIQAYYR